VVQKVEAACASRLTLWGTSAVSSPVRAARFPALVHSAPVFAPGGDRFLQLQAEETQG
jgi:hypothetical protein